MGVCARHERRLKVVLLETFTHGIYPAAARVSGRHRYRSAVGVRLLDLHAQKKGEEKKETFLTAAVRFGSAGASRRYR